MSSKITAKNLSYDTTLPPFLARLRGQESTASGPDPLLAARRRPGQRTRTTSEEAEDAPVVVDENGNIVTLEEAGGKVPGNEDGDQNQDKEEGGKDDSKDVGGEKARSAGIGASKKKRKAGRVVGGGSDNEEEGKAGASELRKVIAQQANKARDSDAATPGDKEKQEPTQDGANSAKSATVTKPAKKKAKKIKLSFDEDEGA